jgi:hypothetical protein
MAEVLLLGMMMSSMSSLTSSILSVMSKPVKNDDYEPSVEMDTGYMEPGTVTGEYEPSVEMDTGYMEPGTVTGEYEPPVEYVTPVDAGIESQDCEGVWSEWGTCLGQCGGLSGQQTRTWSVTTLPRGGGAACPTNTLETQECTTPSCPEWETRTTGGIPPFRKRYKLVDGILIDTINDAEDIGICKTRCINDPECVGFNRKIYTCKLYSGNVEFKKDNDFIPHRGYKIIRNP